MKRLTFLLTLLSLWLMGFSSGNDNYVVLENNTGTVSNRIVATNTTSAVVNEDHILCKRINLGKEYSRIILENGDKIKVHTADIKSYRYENKLFFQLPFYKDGKNTNTRQFLQLVGIKGGFNLFKYTRVEEGVDKATGIYHSASPVNYYVVFRGDRYAYDVTEDNYKDVFKTFGLPLKY